MSDTVSKCQYFWDGNETQNIYFLTNWTFNQTIFWSQLLSRRATAKNCLRRASYEPGKALIRDFPIGLGHLFWDDLVEMSVDAFELRNFKNLKTSRIHFSGSQTQIQITVQHSQIVPSKENLFAWIDIEINDFPKVRINSGIKNKNSVVI